MTALGTMSGVREASGALEVAHRAVRRAGELGRAVVAELGFDVELARVEGLLAARPATVDRELGLVIHAGDVPPRALGVERCYWRSPPGSCATLAWARRAASSARGRCAGRASARP